MSAESAPAPEARTPAPLPAVLVTPDAIQRVKNAGSELILPAVAAVEMVEEVTMSVLNNLGVGLGDGSTFSDAESKAEKLEWLQAYSKAIAQKDMGMVKQIAVPATITVKEERAAARLTAVMRMVRSIVSPDVSSGGGGTHNITVVSKTEEESAYSHDFPGTELETQQSLCSSYYSRPFHADFVPKMAVLKRMCYSVKIDRKLSSLARIPLSALRVSPLEPALVLFKRWCIGYCIIAVGVSPPAGFESGGYGEAGGSILWLSWWDCLDLLDTLEIQLALLGEAARTSVIESIINIVAGATGAGSPRITASCAIGRAVSDAVRIVASACAADAQSRKRKNDDGSGEPQLGTNGLVRMKGGNPAGAPCRDFKKNKCSRSTCSFSHELQTSTQPAEQPPAAERAGDGA